MELLSLKGKDIKIVSGLSCQRTGIGLKDDVADIMAKIKNAEKLLSMQP